MNLADLQRQFDEWEERTRGHLSWPYRVPLEPPYVPLLAERRLRSKIIDDARKPGWWERWRGRSASAGVTPEDASLPAQQPRLGPDDLVELQILVPKDFSPRWDLTRLCLEALSGAGVRLSFEVVGRKAETVVQFVCEAKNKSQVLSTLRGFFPDVRVRPRSDDLLAAWSSSDGWGAILGLGLKERVFRQLRVDERVDADPYIDVVARLGELEDGELGVVQALFEPAFGRWGEDFIQFGRGIEDVDHVLPWMEDKFGERQFGVSVRVAGVGATSERAVEIAQSLAVDLSVATRSD